MDIHHLVKMANDIGAFFRSEPDTEEAARAVATHLKKFWDPRMRTQIIAHHAAGGSGLDQPAKRGVALLAGDTKPK